MCFHLFSFGNNTDKIAQPHYMVFEHKKR
jgi:hypothetical protein